MSLNPSSHQQSVESSPSPSLDSSNHPVESESISLRPGGTSISLRPGGGITPPPSSSTSPPDVSLRPGGGSVSLRPGGGSVSLRPGGGSVSLRPGGGNVSLRPGGGTPSFASSVVSSPSSPYSFPSSADKRLPRSSPHSKKPSRVYTKDFMLTVKPNATQIPPNIVKIDSVFCTTPYGPADVPAPSPSKCPSPTLAPHHESTAHRRRSGDHTASRTDRWIPPTPNAGLTFIIDDAQKRAHEFEKRVRKVVGLLNRFTPDNFQLLSSKILALLHNQAEVGFLGEITGHVFDKAVSEPAYANMWAHFCSNLAHTFKSSSVGHFDFRDQLLRLCQAEFLKSLQEALSESHPASHADRDAMSEGEIADLEERLFKKKQRRIGNICFIGELYTKELLACRVILTCVTDLISIACHTEHPLLYRIATVELFCKLLNLLGPSLEQNIKSKNELDQFFEKFAPLVTTKTGPDALPIRIRFLLEALINRRNNGWVSDRKRSSSSSTSTTTTTLSTSSTSSSTASIVSPSTSLVPPHATSSPSSSPKARATKHHTETFEGLSSQLQRAIDALLSQYFTLQDLTAAEQGYLQMNLTESTHINQFVSELILTSIDNIHHLPLITSLLLHYIHRSIFPSHHVYSALISLITSLPSLNRDFGSIAEKNLAQIISVFSKNNLTDLNSILSSPLLSTLASNFPTFHSQLVSL